MEYFSPTKRSSGVKSVANETKLSSASGLMMTVAVPSGSACGVGMFRAQRFFADFERALMERFRLGIVAHVSIKHRQIVEAPTGVGMFRAQRFFADFERALIERFRLGVFAHVKIKVRQ